MRTVVLLFALLLLTPSGALLATETNPEPSMPTINPMMEREKAGDGFGVFMGTVCVTAFGVYGWSLPSISGGFSADILKNVQTYLGTSLLASAVPAAVVLPALWKLGIPLTEARGYAWLCWSLLGTFHGAILPGMLGLDKNGGNSGALWMTLLPGLEAASALALSSVFPFTRAGVIWSTYAAGIGVMGGLLAFSLSGAQGLPQSWMALGSAAGLAAGILSSAFDPLTLGDCLMLSANGVGAASLQSLLLMTSGSTVATVMYGGNGSAATAFKLLSGGLIASTAAAWLLVAGHDFSENQGYITLGVSSLAGLSCAAAAYGFMQSAASRNGADAERVLPVTALCWSAGSFAGFLAAWLWMEKDARTAKQQPEAEAPAIRLNPLPLLRMMTGGPEQGAKLPSLPFLEVAGRF